MSFLPEEDRHYLAEKNYIFEEKEADGRRGVVFSGYRVPGVRLDAQSARMLILIPPGYPDVPPDMFYMDPWLRVVPSNSFPRAADVSETYFGVSWQRWSRHSSEWRPGVDGIWTMLKRVDHALELAA
jgi:Prokaryotic E2 family E